MKMKKKTLAIVLFAVAFICVVSVSALVIWQAMPSSGQQPVVVFPPQEPVVVDSTLYPALADNGLWGYINSKGEMVLPPAYEQAEAFIGSVAWVKQAGLWGAVNGKGQAVIANQYRTMEYADQSSYPLVIAVEGKNASLYDGDGNKIFGVEGEIRNLSGGLMSFSRAKESKMLWGCMDSAGSIVVEPVYKNLGMASNNRILVQTFEDQKLLLDLASNSLTPITQDIELNALGNDRILQKEASGTFRYLGLDQQPAFTGRYHAAQVFRNNSALVKVDKGYGLIDPQGNWLLEPVYAQAEDLGNGYYSMQKAKGKTIVDSTGKILLEDCVYMIGNWQRGILNLQTETETRFIKLGVGLLTAPKAPLQYNLGYVGQLLVVKDENGIAYFKPTGSLVYAMGRDLYLPDQKVMKPRLDNLSPYYQVYYPKVLAVNEGDLSESFQSLNRRLYEAAMGEYVGEYKEPDGTFNFSIKGGYQYEAAANVITVLQKTWLQDLWVAADNPAGTELVYETISFDKNSGRQYSLTNLFKKGLNWRSDLTQPAKAAYTKACKAAGIAGDNQVLDGLNERFSRNLPYVLTTSQLKIYIQRSDAAYEEICINYQDILTMIDEAGALYQALQPLG